MGKVKKKPLPTPDTNPVDGDKLIKATKPKKVKKTEEKPKEIKDSSLDIKKIRKDLDNLGNWVADIDDDLSELTNLVERMAARMGLK